MLFWGDYAADDLPVYLDDGDLVFVDGFDTP